MHVVAVVHVEIDTYDLTFDFIPGFGGSTLEVDFEVTATVMF